MPIFLRQLLHTVQWLFNANPIYIEFHHVPECVQTYLLWTVGFSIIASQYSLWQQRRWSHWIRGASGLHFSTHTPTNGQLLTPTSLVPDSLHHYVRLGYAGHHLSCNFFSWDDGFKNLSWQVLYVAHNRTSQDCYTSTVERDLLLDGYGQLSTWQSATPPMRRTIKQVSNWDYRGRALHHTFS